MILWEKRPVKIWSKLNFNQVTVLYQYGRHVKLSSLLLSFAYKCKFVSRYCKSCVCRHFSILFTTKLIKCPFILDSSIPVYCAIYDNLQFNQCNMPFYNWIVVWQTVWINPVKPTESSPLSFGNHEREKIITVQKQIDHSQCWCCK